MGRHLEHFLVCVMNSKIFVECVDLRNFSCDVLVLKFAQGFFGADEIVANLLRPKSLEELSPLPGKFVLLPSQGKLAASKVLFVGTLPLYRFDYGQVREFANAAMKILAEQAPLAEHVAMTIHGVGFGLDERESFIAQIAGLFDALRHDAAPTSLKRITIVERNPDRAVSLKRYLQENFPPELSRPEKHLQARGDQSTIFDNVGVRSNDKPHVFVAMPFKSEMRDVYRFGIQGPVNAAGLLCERMDMTTYTGDILTRIKARIETASMVIADLTGANANVYLEVGYAWGKERPTLLVAKKGEELKFDVIGQ
ncbi:MAG TPA: hypothetical protein VGB61_10845, partial [Pyrinomonadaceae bacterium]